MLYLFGGYKKPLKKPDKILYLKNINFRAVVIFAPRKNAKITTKIATRENSDAHLVCMHANMSIF